MWSYSSYSEDKIKELKKKIKLENENKKIEK